METFTVDQLPEMSVHVGKVSATKIKRGLFSAALRLVNHIKSNVIDSTQDEVVGGRNPVDRGIFRAAWAAQKIDEGAEVYNSAPYASIIEHGARAEHIKISRAMIAALAEWVLRKGVISKSKQRALKRKGGKGMFSFMPLALEAQSVAWAIALSMQKKGIFAGGKGLRVLERARKKIPEFVQAEVARELAR